MVDLSERMQWKADSGKRCVLEIQKLYNKFRYKVFASGFNLSYEKVRTIIHKNGAGEVIHQEEKVV